MGHPPFYVGRGGRRPGERGGLGDIQRKFFAMGGEQGGLTGRGVPAHLSMRNLFFFREIL